MQVIRNGEVLAEFCAEKEAQLLDRGAEITFPMEAVNGSKEIDLGGKHRIRSLKLCKLIKRDNPSAFPALRQIEVYGADL